ncbi:sugar ABC transporter permease [Streptomyces sp. NPDC047981]|uniref:carbohydrate ABC transporter permease n=1 Tax=Streptomyces sp. NPDC047981 TaxID=3154610 RepID=UPI00344A0D6B
MTATAARPAGPLVHRPGSHRDKPRRRATSTGRAAWVLLTPLIAINALVVAIPSLLSVYYSFTDWSGIGEARFIGLDNYTTMFTDPEIRIALGNNLLWTVGFLTFPMAMALAGAFLLTRIRRFQILFRICFFVPYVIGAVLNSAIWRVLLSPDTGIGSVFDINPLGDPDLALGSVGVVTTWGWWGFLLVIFLAAMRGVNPSVYEASELDGAGPLRQFLSITLPSIRPTFVFLALQTVIWSFMSFDYIFILTGGGPGGASDMLSTVLYRDSFSANRAGYGCAMGVLIALIAVAVLSVYYLLRRRKGWEL